MGLGMSYAVLFSGQGTQHVGMLPWLESEPLCQPMLQAMEQVLGNHWRSALEDATTRSSNAFAQPLLVGTSLAAWTALQAQLPERPMAVAGYSVGELAAYACAGALPPHAALALVVQRAARMDAAVVGIACGLLSVSGLPVEQVLQAHAELDCAIAIGPQQAIYAGTLPQLQASALALAQRGAVCTELDVRVASHSRWMAPAAIGFAQDLAGVPLARPHATLVLNSTGASTRDLPLLRSNLSDQLACTVQWAACMDALAEQGVACVIEIGAGSTLAKMWNQRHPAIPARSISEFRDVAGAARWLQRSFDAR
jgi:[acyl-carrier-protein] S-malonyltransferase